MIFGFFNVRGAAVNSSLLSIMYNNNVSYYLTTSGYLTDYTGITDANDDRFYLTTTEIGGGSGGGGNATNASSMHDDFGNCPPTDMPLANIFFMILYAIVCIIGLMGNTLVIYVVLRFSNMQTVTNMYILNLAIADECFLIGIPFLIATMNMGHWVFGRAMCKAYLVR